MLYSHIVTNVSIMNIRQSNHTSRNLRPTALFIIYLISNQNLQLFYILLDTET
jgi:hypothetical protein